MSGKRLHPQPSPPGWHSSLRKHGHKSWLPPRPALGPPSPTTWGPRLWHPPQQGVVGQPLQNGGIFPVTSPQCSGCLRSSPSSSPRKALCYYLLLDSSWVPTVKSSLGKRKACFSAPTHCPPLPFLPSLPPQSCSERARWGLRPHSNPQQMRTEPALCSLGTRWAKTGVTVEGSGVTGALAECRAAPPTTTTTTTAARYLETILGRQEDGHRRQVAPVG